MVGYHKFLELTLERWKRFVIVQNVSPLTPKDSLEEYFGNIGPVERIRFINNPDNGCYMRKALLLMKSQFSAAEIIRKRHHSVGTDGFVTTVEYKGGVRQYKHGRFKLFVILPVPLPRRAQATVEGRSYTSYHLIRELVKAYHGYMFTSIKLDTDAQDFYSGFATVRFEFETDKERILERTKQKLHVEGLWADTKDKNYDAKKCYNTVVDEFIKGKELKDYASDEKFEEHASDEKFGERALDEKFGELALDENALDETFGEHDGSDEKFGENALDEKVEDGDWDWNVDEEW